MSNAGPGLAFEQPIYELEQELDSLESEETGDGQSAKVRDLKNHRRYYSGYLCKPIALGNRPGSSTPGSTLHARLPEFSV